MSAVQVDKDVIYGIAQEAFVSKRPLTEYLCEQEPIVKYRDFHSKYNFDRNFVKQS